MIRSKVPSKEYRNNFDEIVWHSEHTPPSGTRVKLGRSPIVIHDIQPFRSPVDGSVVTSRKKLREHNARNGVVSAGDLTPEFSAKQARAVSRERETQEKRGRVETLRDAWEHVRDKSKYFR